MPLLRIPQRKLLRVLLISLVISQYLWLTVLPVNAAGSAEYSFASGAFRKVWERPDFPVAAQRATRSFTWGPEGFAFLEEPYAESPGGKRLVQYFDKTRMEITNPGGDRNSPYYITNGLLVREMVTGRLQEGNEKFLTVAAANVPVAGDPADNPGPTYRSFQGVADRPVARRTGETVKATIDRDGKIGESDDLANKYPVKYVDFNPELSHNIPDVFRSFMYQKGVIYQAGQFVNGPVIDWVSTMGFPITEAYWSRVVVAGQEKDVLIQLFERRVLTYTPANSDAYKVEMGNVGSHYYAWRYPNQPFFAPWASIRIENGTTCNPVTITLSGQDDLIFDVPTKATKSYKLGPGNYNYKVTGTGCGVNPLEDTFTVKLGEEYRSVIYLS